MNVSSVCYKYYVLSVDAGRNCWVIHLTFLYLLLACFITVIVRLMADGPSFLYEKLVRESWYKNFVRVS